MYLYRFEVLANQEIFPVVVVANNDDSAFKVAEGEVEKHFLKLPTIEEISLHEKKSLRGKGVGFVIHE